MKVTKSGKQLVKMGKSGLSDMGVGRSRNKW